MSANLATSPDTPSGRSPGQGLSVAQFILSAVVVVASATGAFVSVKVTQGNLETRVSAAESTITRNREESKAETKEIRAQFMTREEFKIYWDGAQRDLGEIKADVKEIRRATTNSK